ncbi:hypothetical protein [Oligoflexus tunisiensis]|uniref:hypothetical protein n=1 Tax=Oligoflexus tunisiensis TaxID=708132 RepID=UPI00114CA31C|nr:hypothetical protein [Oligoflexus tunisiensis]
MRWQTLTGTAVSFLAIHAQPGLSKDFENWTHFGLRPLGMGNAYVAVADDYNALFYNPAGLARLKEWDGEFLNPRVDLSTNLGGLMKDVQDKLKSGKVSDTLELIEANTGKSYHAGFGLTPHLIFKNFGFGIGIDVGASMVFHKNIAADFDAGVRLVMPFTFAMNFLDDKLSVGASLKGRVRAGVDRQFTMEDIEAFQTKGSDTSDKKINDYALGGFGTGADVGLLFTPTKTMEPTIGVSVTDVGATSYETQDIGGEAVGNPAPQLASVNVGFSLKPVQKDKFYVLTSMDMHSINQPYSFSKKWNLGTEVGYGSIIKLQAGLYQGYLTGGFQFDVGVINLRAITYAEELGTQAGFQEDRRYAVQIKLLL